MQTDPSESILTWQDLSNFCRDSKRHLSSTGLSPGQISHPCFKVCKCANSSANYLQVLITWPNQFISPYFIFLESQIFPFELSKKRKSAAGRHTTWKISAPTFKVWQSYRQLSTALQGKCQTIPTSGWAFSSTCSLARKAWTLCQLHDLSLQLFLMSQEQWFVVCIVSGLLKTWRLKCGRHSLKTGGLYSRGRWINHGYCITLERLTHYSYRFGVYFRHFRWHLLQYNFHM